jgi:hypothetical protein
LLQALLAFASGSREEQLLAAGGTSQPFHPSSANSPAGPSYGLEAGAEYERARVSGQLERLVTELPAAAAGNPSSDDELQVFELEDFAEELAAGPAASHLLGPSAHAALSSWFATHAEVAELIGAHVVVSSSGAIPHDGAAGRDEEELAVAQQQQENVQLESVSTPSSDAEATGGVPTDMMLNLWASISDIDDAQMQMSSFMQRSTLDSLVMAHDTMQLGQPPAAAAATMFGTTTQYPAMPVSATPAFHNVLAYHQLPGQHQSASTPHQRMQAPELSAASTTALVAAPSSSMNRLQAAGLPLAPADPSSHVRQGMLAQLAGDTRMAPAASARAVDQQLGNPSESTVRSRAAAVSLYSPFKSFEPINRHSKLRRLDDSRDTGNIAGPSKPRQPMIELWIKDLCPRIQESDRMKRQLQLGATAAGSSMNPAGAAGGSFMQGDTQVSADQQYYSPGWIEEQAQIAQKHMLAERDRRFKFKEKIHTLCSIVPTTKKVHNIMYTQGALGWLPWTPWRKIV